MSASTARAPAKVVRAAPAPTALVIPERALEGEEAAHVIALGKTRSGKSTAMRGLVEHLLDKGKRVCVVDPKGDWWGLRVSADGKSAGLPVVIFGGGHADVPINAHAGGPVAELVATGNRPCIVDVSDLTVGERTRFFVDFAQTLFRLIKGEQLYLVIDEVHNFAPQGKVYDPAAGQMLHWANRLSSEGLGKGITLLAASQRPQKVHKDFITSCETLIAMRVIHKRDRQAYADWIEACGDPTVGKRVLETVAQMKRGEAWVWSPEIDFGPTHVKFPMFRTYDSFDPRRRRAAADALPGWAGIDLAEVTAKLADAVEEAKANDPTALKKRIVQLERELRTPNTNSNNSTAPVIDEAVVAERVQFAVDQAEQSLKLRYVREGEAFADALQQLGVRLSAARDRLADGMASIGAALDAIPGVVDDARAKLNEVSPAPAPADRMYVGGSRTNELRLLGKPRRSRVGESQERPPIPPGVLANLRKAAAAPARGAPSDGLHLSGSQQRIVDALLAFERLRIAPVQKSALAAMVKASPISSTYSNNVGALHSAGLLLYPTPGWVALTDAGRDRAKPTSLPSLDAYHDGWRDVLTSSQGAILDMVISHYPDALSKTALAELVGASPTSSTYSNNLGAMRSRGIIDYPEKGHVVATALMFPKGLR